jgi:predicted RND superfamily exporter protein
MLRRFGMVAAIGVMISYLILITFVPAALTYFAPPKHVRAEEAAPSGRIEKLLVPMTARIVAKPYWVIGLTVLAMVPCIWAYTAIRVDTSLRDTFDADDPIVASMIVMEEHLDGIRPLEIAIESETEGRLRDPEVLAALERIARWAEREEGVLRTTTPNDFLWETWRRIAGLPRDAARPPFASREQVEALVTLLGRVEPNPIESYLTPDGKHARIEIRLADIGAQRSIQLIRRIGERVDQELAATPGLR